VKIEQEFEGEKVHKYLADCMILKSRLTSSFPFIHYREIGGYVRAIGWLKG
jgi:hypothetical protein